MCDNRHNKRSRTEGTILYFGKEISKRRMRQIRAQIKEDDIFNQNNFNAEEKNALASKETNLVISPEERNLAIVVEETSPITAAEGTNKNLYIPVRNLSSLTDELIPWVRECGISLNSTTRLLHILHDSPYVTDASLPRDARTLLGTSRASVELKDVFPGKFFYFTIAKNLAAAFPLYSSLIKNNTISIAVNIDGLSIFESTNFQFWPLLIRIVPTSVILMVGLYAGNKKPKCFNDVLEDFVKEINNLIDEGIVLNAVHFNVQLHHIICDAPARSNILNTKNHNAYGSCPRCHVEGEWINGRVSFFNKNKESQLRTVGEFLKQSDPRYHLGETVLVNIKNFDIIQEVPFDYLHVVLEGVQKKLIELWLKGVKHDIPKSRKLRITNIDMQIIDRHIENIASYCPDEFQRKGRCDSALSQYSSWRGTEFRQVLLYTGIIAFSAIEKVKYKHYLLLHYAMRKLTIPNLCETELSEVHKLLRKFVKNFTEIYGKEFVSHNVHVLLHMVDDYKKFGPVVDYSCFDYENYLGKLKKTVHSGFKPQQQAVLRYLESMKCGNIRKGTKNELPKTHLNGPVPIEYENNCIQYRIMKVKDFILKSDNKNSFVITNSSDILKITNFFTCLKTNTEFFVGHKFCIKTNVYEYPFPSSKNFTYFVSNLDETSITLPVSEIKTKLFGIPYQNDLFAVLPLLHTL